MGHKSILTTWEAGRYCGVSPYTVRHWVQTGKLRAYTTPGGHRRIRRQDMDAFLLAHGMPLPAEFREGARRVLLLVEEGSGLAKDMEGWSEALDVRVAASAFDAGLALGTFDPHLFMVDLDASAWDGLEVCRRVHATPSTAHVLLAGISKEASVEVLEAGEEAGVLHCFAKPLDLEEVRRFFRRLFPYAPWIPPVT